MTQSRIRLAGLGALISLALLSQAVMTQEIMAQSPPVQYRLSFRQAATHRIEIEASFPTEGAASIRLMMPVWTPGSYLVREYARHVESLDARDGISHQPLNWKKVDKNHWQIECNGVQEVVVHYTLYGREMGVRTNWIETEFAFLTGAATFLTKEDALDHPHIVHIDALPSWPEIATSLPPIDAKSRWSRRAANYDELVDSPIVLGDIDIQSATIGGVPHYLATLGADSMWDTPRAMKDVAKIVELEQKFWGDVPYPEYWFLNLATESGGGLEHDNSCILMTSRWSQKQKSKYIDWLSLVSHEFFHAWNVRRLRPRALQQYDYNAEQYMQELWVAEGITSYYDNLFVARAGLCTPNEYLERLSKEIAAVENAPGRLVQNLEDSSFDTWIKFYRPDENANNSRISYYVKGSLVGLLLDTEIRMATDNQKSLDDCMRLLWQRHRDSGYTNEDMDAIVIEVGGESLRGWLPAQLKQAAGLDYAKLHACFGLQWRAKNGSTEGPAPATPSMIGIEISNQGGKAMVDKVSVGGAGAAAGIQVGDELIGWGGYRMTPEQWSDRLGLYRAGDRVAAILARRGKLLEVSVEIAPAVPNSWSLQRVDSPDEKQEIRWKSWLQIPEPPAETAPADAPAVPQSGAVQ